MKTRATLPILLLLALAACGPRGMSAEQYSAGWLVVMTEFERTASALPEPELQPDWSVERKRAAAADAIVAAGGEMDRVAKMQDTLRPPKSFARFHELSSRFLHEEGDLFREYAEAARKATRPIPCVRNTGSTRS